jgi:hypothetical protein
MVVKVNHSRHKLGNKQPRNRFGKLTPFDKLSEKIATLHESNYLTKIKVKASIFANAYLYVLHHNKKKVPRLKGGIKLHKHLIVATEKRKHKCLHTRSHAIIVI